MSYLVLNARSSRLRVQFLEDMELVDFKFFYLFFFFASARRTFRYVHMYNEKTTRNISLPW